MSPLLRSARRTRTRVIQVLTLTLALVAGLLLAAPPAAHATHNASDYFIFSRAELGKYKEVTCNSSNDKQSDVSGSNIPPAGSPPGSAGIFGRIHSNSDHATSGQGIVFKDPVTFDSHAGTCQVQPELNNNTYLSGPPAPDPSPPGLGTGTESGSGWPGNLSDFLDIDSSPETPTHDVGFSTLAVALPGASCAIVDGVQTSLTGTSDITLDAADGGKVVCNGTGKITISISDVGTSANPFRITMISHGTIEISGQNVVVAPFVHNILAFTDQCSEASPGCPSSLTGTKNYPSIKLSGSNFDVEETGILFAPRSGVDVSGSNDSELCIQLIGQGANKVAGSNSTFGPGLCGAPANVVTEIHAHTDAVTGAPHTVKPNGSVVEVGTGIHDKVTVTSTTNPLTNLEGDIVLKRFTNGTCTDDPNNPNDVTTATWSSNGGPPGPSGGTYAPATSVTIDPALPFTPAVGVYSYQASYGGDENNLAAAGSCEGPLFVVDAGLDLTPNTDANEVGANHDILATVTVSGGNIATGGATVTGTIESGPGSFVDPAPAGQCTTAAGASPKSCTLTISSSSPGTTVVSASASIPIDVDGNGTADITLTRATGSAVSETGAVSKRWVAVRILITPAEATNPVDTDHDITITLQWANSLVPLAPPGSTDPDDFDWKPLVGEVVTAALVNSGGATATFVDPAPAGQCTTLATGSCIVTINSPTPGTTTVNGFWAGGTVDGATISAKDTDPSTVNVSAGPGGDNRPSSKIWIGFRIIVLTCTEDTTDPQPLVVSGVDPTTPNLAAANTLGTAPAFAGQTQDALQQYLCSLGGASFGGLEEELHTLTVDVNDPI